jgi:hypothetical protein
MWIFTRDGFFSIVHDRYCEADQLMIRARVRNDLERLKGKIDAGDIIEIENADYLYRMPANRHDVGRYLSEQVIAMDYDNFKNTVEFEDHARHRAYMSVWGSMRDLQEEEKAGRPKGGG